MKFVGMIAVSFAALAMAGCAVETGTDSSSTEGASTASSQEATDSLSAETMAQARKILADKIPAYYGADGQTFGVVTVHGKANLSATDDEQIVHAVGEFESNELWGGAFLYRYDVNVDLSTGLIKQLKKPVQVKEIN
jgi:hypothetical protein